MIRLETQQDYKEVNELVSNVYTAVGLTCDIQNLRGSEFFESRCSIVVQEGWDVVGHIACLKNQEDESILEIKSFAVLEVLQNSGVGLQLIMALQEQAKKLGFSKIIVNSNLDCFKRYRFIKTDNGFEFIL
jgi:predicted N-acetyltransferase YhbS